MLRYIGFVSLIIAFTSSVFAQEVTGFHDVQRGSEPNEYKIKTTISGLKDVDIARIKYLIDNKHTYKPSPNNALFSDRNESYIKFYIMAVPSNGELNIELGVVIADANEYAFPVEFQYSKDEEKQTINLPQISLSDDGGALAVIDNTEPEIPEIEEIPEPTVEETPEPIVEEQEVVLETPKTEEIPVIVEEPAVEDIPEIEPEVIETPEKPTDEEDVEVDKTPEETIPESNPVVEVEETPGSPVVEEPEVNTDPITEEVPESIIEEPEEIETPTSPISTASSRVVVKYTVQLLSLSEFSQTRLNTFCRQHNLSINDVKKNQVGKWMKITYGEANSIAEANQIKEKLMRDNNISEAFVTPVK